MGKDGFHYGVSIAAFIVIALFQLIVRLFFIDCNRYPATTYISCTSEKLNVHNKNNMVYELKVVKCKLQQIEFVFEQYKR